jgi:hypothetical protein
MRRPDEFEPRFERAPRDKRVAGNDPHDSFLACSQYGNKRLDGIFEGPAVYAEYDGEPGVRPIPLPDVIVRRISSFFKLHSCGIDLAEMLLAHYPAAP